MNNKRLAVLILLMGLLSGCSNEKRPRLDIFYTTTCASCQALEENLLKKLDASDYEIVMHDIDEQESIELYQNIINQLEDPGVSLKTNLSVPMIVYEKKFAMVGYIPSMDDTIIALIAAAKAGEIDKNQLPSGTWIFKEES